MTSDESKPLATIIGVQPEQDDEGRFRLDDVHRAYGSAPRHAPTQFLRDEQTRRLIAALEDDDDCSIAPVNTTYQHDGGTFVARELVYAYVGWVDPEFLFRMIESVMNEPRIIEAFNDLFGGGIDHE